MAEPEPTHLAELLAPLAKLVLNVQLVALLLLTLQSSRATTTLLVALVMAVTAVGPVLAWSRVGPSYVRSVWPLVPSLLLAVGAGAAQEAAPTLSIAYGVSIAVFAGLLHGARGGFALAALVAFAFVPFAPSPVSVATLAAVVGVLAGAVAGARLRRLSIDLDASRRRVASQVMQLATAEERARVARELHDSLGKTVEGVHMTLRGLQRHVGEDGRPLFDQAMTGVDRARQEARQLMVGLRGGDDAAVPLATSLRGLATTFGEVAGIASTVEMDGAVPELAPERRHEVLQVVREALRNVAAHSGADHVSVRTRAVDGALQFTVLDDGSGQVRERPGHFGLQGMRERAARLGGQLQVKQRDEGGTMVALEVPVAEGTET